MDENRPSTNDKKHRQLIDRFLQRAKPVLAAERGLNERSRAKLKSLADELHLDDESFNRALVLIQNGDSATTQLSRYERSFVKLLKRELGELRENILTAKLEQKAIDIAFDKFQLEPQRAGELIQSVAEELNLSRISRSDSQRHVAEIVTNLIGNAPYMTDEVRDRLYLAGEQWGMERSYVDSVIIAKLTENRERAIKKRSGGLGKIPLVIMTLVLAAGLGGFLFWYFQGDDDVPPKSTESTTSPESIPVIDRLPVWWDDSARLNIVKVRHKYAWIENELENLVSEDSAKRRAAYLSITQKFLELQVQEKTSETSKPSDWPEHRDMISRLIAFWYAHEPDETVALQWLDALCRHLELTNGELPEKTGSLETAISANQLIARAATATAIPTSRKSAIDKRATALTGWSVSDNLHGYLQSSTDAIVSVYWNHLILNIAANPAQAVILFDHVRVKSESLIDSKSHQRFQLRFIIALINHDSSLFAKIKTPASILIRKCQATQLSPLAAIVREVESTSDQQWLIDQFANRVKRAQGKRGPDALDIIEEYYGVIPPELIRKRAMARQWDVAEQNLGIADFHSIKADISADELAYLSHVNTIAWYLHFDESSESIDRKFKLNSIDLSKVEALESVYRNSPFALDLLRASNADKRFLKRYLSQLDFKPDRTPTSRVSGVKRLGDISNKFRDIEPQQARQFAAYLLDRRIELDEWAGLQIHVQNFSHWANLLVAVADKIDDPRTSFDRTSQLVKELTLNRIEIDRETIDWRQTIQQRLFEYVGVGLQQRAIEEGASMSSKWNSLRAFVDQQLIIRARLISETVTEKPEIQMATASESADMGLLIALSRGFEFEQELARRILAARLITEDELAQSVLLKQWSVPLLVNFLELNSPQSSEELDRLLSAFNQAIENATTLRQQLAICEYAQIRILRAVQNHE